MPSDDDFTNLPTILVVDDDRILTTLFARLLATMGKVIQAHSGAEGLELARTQNPDLILLDVQMPGMDGFDTISELKTDPTVRHIPVIFITADTLPEIESHCLESGAADYIAKPVNPRVLQARARTHLLIKQQADMLADLSFRDALTGTLNRGAWDDALQTECGRAAYKARQLSLLLVDVDDFAAYNRTYGHVAGDDVLMQVAAAIQGVLRNPGEVVGRVGGDRFAVVLPESKAPEAAQAGERICAAVRKLAIRNAGSSVAGTVTVSVGVASRPGGITAGELNSLAREQLLRAKDGGHDRACVAA